MVTLKTHRAKYKNPVYLETIPTWIEPMLATLVDEPVEDAGWIFEPKLDGERCLAFRDGKKLNLFSRNHINLNDSYPELVQELLAQPASSFVLDGEIVAYDEGTIRPSFRQMQKRMHNNRPSADLLKKVPVHYFVFDILFDRQDLRGKPLLERKAILESVLKPDRHIHMNEVRTSGGKAFFQAACHDHLEGVIAKRVDSPYVSTRSRDWIKLKCINEEEFVIGGYSDPTGGRSHFGALLIGRYEGSDLKFAGKVGTGFDEALLGTIYKKLKALARATSPFQSVDIPRRGLHWVEPELVAQIVFSEWTSEGKLRHPRFLGLRDDKPAKEVTMATQTPQPAPKSTGDKLSTAKSKTVQKDSQTLTVGKQSVTLSHLNKVFYPSTGFTKGEILNYYIQIAPFMLPHLKDRPLTMKRYPNGVAEPFFYEKNAPSYKPDWLKTSRMTDPKASRSTDYTLIHDLPSLLWVANLGCLEFHVLMARAPQVDVPTAVVFDMDPGPSIDLIECAEAALTMRKLLDSLGLKSFPKTSGSKGIHIYVPVNNKITYDDSQDFAHAVALLLEKQHPKWMVSNMRKELRVGKILVDWSQNSRHKTTVCAYSLRATEQPYVSAPVTWNEVEAAFKRKDLARLQFSPEQVLKRVAKNGDLFADVTTLEQTLPTVKPGSSKP